MFNDANSLLNMYRISILSNEELFDILALVFRDIFKTEEEIVNAINIEPQKVKENITKLYRNGLLEVDEGNQYKLTKAAIFFLKQIGLAETASTNFIEQAALDEIERKFLKACVEARASAKDEITDYQLAFSRILSRLKGDFWSDGDEQNSKKVKTRVYYALIIGLDPDIKSLNCNEYIDAVFNWHFSNKTSIWRKYEDVFMSKKKHFINSCELAVKDISVCNTMIYKGKSPSDSFDFDIAAKTAYLRFISPLLEEVSDQDFKTAIWINANLSSNLAKVLSSRKDKLDSVTYQIFLVYNPDLKNQETKVDLQWATNKLDSWLYNYPLQNTSLSKMLSSKNIVLGYRSGGESRRSISKELQKRVKEITDRIKSLFFNENNY